MRQLQRHISELGHGSYIRKILAFLLLTITTLPLSAETESNDAWLKKDNTAIDSVIPKKKHNGLARFFSSLTETDTNYVKQNEYNMQAMVYSDMKFNIFKISGKDENSDKTQNIYFSPYSKVTIGPYFSYSLIFMGYTFNIGRKGNSYDRSNIYLSIYSPIIGIDYYNQKGENNYRIKRVSGFNNIDSDKLHNLQFPGMDAYLQNLHVYYVFSHKKFSYTAAYSQSGRQIRSAGSFMLGFNYARQKIHFDYTKLPSYLLYDSDNNPLLYDALKVSNINYKNFSFSFGYSYNWTFAKNMLFNLTLTPSIGYNVNKGDKLEINNKLFRYRNINFDFISRSALVWNSGRFYAGISGVAHTYSYRKSYYSVLNALFNVNAYAGINFWKKKEYRKKK